MTNELLTEIKCPTCGTPGFKVSPVSQSMRLAVRCTAPECRRRYTAVFKPHAANPADTVVTVGFTQTDRERNGAKRGVNGALALDVTALGSLPLTELHKVASEYEDFVSALVKSYEEDLDRMISFYRRRKHAAEQKVTDYKEEHRPRTVQQSTKVPATKVPAKPKESKGKKQVGMSVADYRELLFQGLSLQVSLGIISPTEEKSLRSDAMTTDGCMRLADRLKMPRLA